jgi:fluoride exporter
VKLQPDNSKPLAETALDRAADLRREPARQWTALSDKVVLYGAVSLGAVIGGVLRALASNGTLALLGPGFPWGTFLVNVLGSFVIGFFATLTGPDGRVFASTRQRQFVMTGICGGFTTFSMFSLETIRLAQEGKLAAAVLNIGISIIGWFGAVWLGHLLALRMNRLKGS